jgi:UDP-N-acetylglucosamine 1-carboxyvinyltransferase
LQAIISKLREMGCRIRDTDEGLLLTMWGRPKAADLIETMPYPGFPTDMQAQFLALCSIAQ